MKLFHYKRKRHKPPQKSRITLPARLMALLLCLSLISSSSYVLADGEEQRFSDIADFTSIMLYYGSDNGEPSQKVEDGALLQAGTELYLRYDYTLKDSAYMLIEANKPYYLEISPHLVLPDWGNDGKKLKLTNEDGTDGKIFGRLYANGTKVWVEFTAGKNGNGTVLSDLYSDGITLEDTYFYLNCQRAGSIPSGEAAIDGQFNRYVIKFEKDKYQLTFGYKEYEPVRAEAQLTKDGSLTDKTIHWTIKYTPGRIPMQMTMRTASHQTQLSSCVTRLTHQSTAYYIPAYTSMIQMCPFLIHAQLTNRRFMPLQKKTKPEK